MSININLIGTFNVLRLAAAEMTKLDELDEGERGVIVNTASVRRLRGPGRTGGVFGVKRRNRRADIAGGP